MVFSVCRCYRRLVRKIAQNAAENTENLLTTAESHLRIVRVELNRGFAAFASLSLLAADGQ
ncbi:hypothetical protein SADFL11_00034360 [Roseibium alexandrii DFL-11]|uniref:Uncharacterized protein n=1 Tax=Roseibium alexandrii (strain DSM 17067 / NCIMB 14079 / DFL-11) TaxID=244592 RepID=A0A5E8UXE5_ROSAD|nr:hypothetical protein SADFL11_00034360 [Roseibium alexandrii DFL-11]